MLNELIVKIGADMKEFIASFDKLQQMTGLLSNEFQQMANEIATSMNEVQEEIKETNQQTTDKVSEEMEQLGKQSQETANEVEKSTKSVTTFFGKTAKEMSQMGSQFRQTGQDLFQWVTLPIGVAGGASIKLASDMQESLNKVNVAFGSSAQEVIKWSETSIDKMGLASGTALDSSALFGDMATSMGLSQQQASKMAMSMVQLGADLASFKNVGIDQAMQALNGVFTGETESLKMLGVVMTQTQLEAFALSQGIKKNIKDFSEAEMVQLRYAFVMDKTKNAQGDFARTSEGSANQMRKFLELLKQVAVDIGNIVLPTFTMLLQKVNEMLKGFFTLSETTKIVIISIAGLGAVLPPLIISLGVIMTALPIMATGFKALGVAIRFAFTNPIGIALTALVALGAYLYTIQGDFDDYILRFKKGATVFVIAWKEMKYGFLDFVTNIQIGFNKTKLAIFEWVSSITNTLGFTIDYIENAIKDINKTIGALQSEQLMNSQKKHAELAKIYADISKMELERAITRAQEAMSTKTEWDQQRFANLASQNKKITEEQDVSYKKMMDDQKKVLDSMMTNATKTNENIGVNQKLQKEQEKLNEKMKEAVKDTEQLRQKNIELANTLQNAVVTALKNKNKAIEETIGRFNNSIENQKSRLDSLKRKFKDTYDEIQQKTKETFDDQREKLKSSYSDQFKQNEDSYKDRVDQLNSQKKFYENTLREEERATINAEFEKRKQQIVSDRLMYQSLETRNAQVQKLSDLIIETEKKLNIDNNNIRLDAIDELNSDEMKLLKDNLNSYRKTQVAGIDARINDEIKAYEQMKLEKENQLQRELATIEENYKKQAEEDKKLYDTRVLNAEAYAKQRIEYYKQEIADQTKQLKELNTAEQANLIARKLIMSNNQTEIKKLLSEYNADYFEAGKNYGEQLIKGLESKKVDINNMVKEISAPMSATSSNFKSIGEEFAKNVTNEMMKPTTNAVMPAVSNATKYGGVDISPYSWMALSNATQQMQPQIFLDSREITKSVAPVMVDYVRAKTGTVR